MRDSTDEGADAYSGVGMGAGADADAVGRGSKTLKVLHFARAYGFRNIQTVVNKLKRGKCTYDFVEIMACPNGCLNGGGQVQVPLQSQKGHDASADAGVSAGALPSSTAHKIDLPVVNRLFHSRALRPPETGPLASKVCGMHSKVGTRKS